MLLSALPGSLSAPVVIAQHIPAAFTASLANRLNEACQLAVHEVSRSERLEPGHVYIGRGDADIVLARQGDLLMAKSVPSSPNYNWHPSVNRLAASARQMVDPRRVVGVLLTGMGDDGAVEFAGLKADGGRTIAEAEETAVIWGMPGELVRRGGATLVLPNYRIAEQIVDWVH
jgi:two-component system chemotaxis response regulator CheB